MNIAIIPGKIFQDMIFQLIAPFSDLISWVVEHMGSGEFLPSNWLMDLIADFVCGERIVDGDNSIELFTFCDVMNSVRHAVAFADDLTIVSCQDQTTRLRLFVKM